MPLLSDGDQDVHRHGNQYLRLDHVLPSTEEGFHPKMLFDPSEEQLDLPAAALEFGDGERRQGDVIGQKDQRLVGIGTFEVDTSQRGFQTLGT